MVGSYIEEIFKISKQNNYYVYRFINNEGIIVYVGRTINIDQRMKTHEHLINDNFYSVNENIELTQDQYALTCLLNFLFESDLKNGKPIVLYIPSSRMRKLLENWINNQNYGD